MYASLSPVMPSPPTLQDSFTPTLQELISPSSQDKERIPGVPSLAPVTHTPSIDGPRVGEFPRCIVCGEGMFVTKPNIYVTLFGADKPTRCSAIENSGETGYIEPPLCAILPVILSDCGCSSRPTVSPVPTFVATREPTQTPSIYLRPSLTPTFSISLSPSSLPSVAPSSLPSVAPSDLQLPQLELSEVDLVTVLRRTSPLSPQSKRNWQQVMETQIEDEVRRQNPGGAVRFIKVQTVVQSQDPPFESTAPSASPMMNADAVAQKLIQNRKLGRNRDLQQMLAITFDIDIFLKTNSTGHNVDRYILGAFSSIQDRSAFASALKATHDPAFADTEFIEVILPTEEAPSDPNISAGMIFILLAAAVSGIALLIYYLYSQNKQKKMNVASPEPEPSVAVEAEVIDAHDYATHIDMMSHDDVSTLGDPFPAGLNREPSVASTASVNYDFRNTYRKDGPSVTQSLADVSVDSTIGTATLGTAVTNQYFDRDDETLDLQYFAENQFEVDAPPGMLGLVLESSGDGTPTVHAIKPSSPLSSQVKVGDRLLAVDGEDVTVLLSSDVSRLISTKRDNPIRRFLFTRPSGAPGKQLPHLPVIAQESTPKGMYQQGVKASMLAMIPQETTDTEMSSKGPQSSVQTSLEDALLDPSTGDSEASYMQDLLPPVLS